MALSVASGISHMEPGRTRHCREHHTARKVGGEHKQTLHRLHIWHHIRCPLSLLVSDLTSFSLHQFPYTRCGVPKPSIRGPNTFLLRTFALALPSFPKHFLQRSTGLTPFTVSGFTQMPQLGKALQVTLDKIATPHSGRPTPTLPIPLFLVCFAPCLTLHAWKSASIIKTC